MLLGVCRLWGAGFVVQGTRLAVLCLRVRVPWGVVVAFWGSVVRGCGVVGRPARVLLWGWVRVRVLRACAFSCCGLGGGCAVGFWGGAPWCGLCGVLLVVCWWVLRWVGWL